MNRKSILIEQFILHAENGLITGSDGDLAPEGWDDIGFFYIICADTSGPLILWKVVAAFRDMLAGTEDAETALGLSRDSGRPAGNQHDLATKPYAN